MKHVLLVRYKYTFKPQYVEVAEAQSIALRRLAQGTPCLVVTERGEEYTVSVRPCRPAADAEFPKPIPRFLRLATEVSPVGH